MSFPVYPESAVEIERRIDAGETTFKKAELQDILGPLSRAGYEFGYSMGTYYLVRNKRAETLALLPD